MIDHNFLYKYGNISIDKSVCLSHTTSCHVTNMLLYLKKLNFVTMYIIIRNRMNIPKINDLNAVQCTNNLEQRYFFKSRTIQK